MALNVARASNEMDIATHLELAYDMAEVNRKKWLRKVNELSGPIGMTA
uniref:Uncharacterized protein n=1 Tax=uncultured organism TaxID=155900 RepID=A0A7L9QBV9_9ZZZZ|nr:hypothetical protein [uncultured organism]